MFIRADKLTKAFIQDYNVGHLCAVGRQIQDDWIVIQGLNLYINSVVSSRQYLG